MAEITVSQVTPIVNENSEISIEFLNGQTPVVSSVDVARRFSKKHKHVLDEIRKMQFICPKSFYEPNFRPVDYTDTKGESRPAYLLTRDAFTLLAMGFTGTAAVRWKLRYLEAFNKMENRLSVSQAEYQERLDIAREFGYRQGLSEARALPAAEADRKAAYLDGLKEGERIQKRKDGLGTLERALTYLGKGVNMTDAARLVDVPASTLRQRVQRLRRGLHAGVVEVGA